MELRRQPAPSTTANPSHTYAAPGTYTVVADGHRRVGQGSRTATHDVTMTEPAGNNGPTAVIASGTCTDVHDVRDEQHRDS